jgi:DHA2 family multidrug resistance protein
LSANQQSLPRSAAGQHSPWLIAVIVSMATFMEVLDTSIANVSLPHIAGGVASSLEESTWVLTSYLVSNAIILPISGWLATIVGRKRFYMLCVALFGISSLLCGLAPSLPWLIFFRVLQGLGGGGLAPSEQSILTDTFTPQQRGQAYALYGVAVVVAPTIGPTLGGWITDSYSWRWIFFINIPVAIASLVLTYIFVDEPPAVVEDQKKARQGGIRVDYPGIALIALGLGCLQVVLDKGQLEDWFASDFITSFIIISALALVFLIIWEKLHDHPIIDMKMVSQRNFALCMAMMFVTGFVLLMSVQLIPQFLQSIEPYDATKAGMALTAGGAATLVFMPIVGALLKKVQPRYLIAIGLAIQAGAAYHLAGINADLSFEHAAWARVFQAIGLPFLFVPINTIAYSGLPSGKSNDASALLNSMRNLGGSFGISVGTTLLARRSQFHHARLAEFITPMDQLRHAHLFPSFKALDGVLQQQAGVLSYIDTFWILALVSAVCIPLTFLLQRIKLGGEPAGH